MGEGAQALRGCGYGVRTPALVADIRVAAPPDAALAALDSAMGSLLDERADFPAAEPDAAAALLKRVHHWHAVLQRQQNIAVFGDCAVAAQGEPGVYRFAMPMQRAEASRIALRWTMQAMNRLLSGADAADALRARLDAVRKELRRFGGSATNPIHFAAAAHELGMPFVRTPGAEWVGLGRHSRWLASTLTDATPAIGVQLAKDKVETARALRAFGLPAPEHRIAASEDEAAAAAAALGFPVVVKPAGEDQGRGVAAGLRTEAAVRKAWQAARQFPGRILVEAHCEGRDYRFTVFHGEVVKVMQREAGGVRGDGSATVAQLVAQVQASASHERALRRQGEQRLSLDEEAMDLLREHGLTPHSVPAAGRFVALRRKSNISSGGSHSLVPPENVHPDNIELALQAARLLHLDIAGVDLIIADAARPWHEGPAIVCEVNAQPQIGARDTPGIYKDILRRLVPGDGRVPCHLVVMDDAQAREQAESIARRARDLGCNGASSVGGAWLDGRQVLHRPPDAFSAARNLLSDRRLDAILVVMGAAEILRAGLPAPQFDSAGFECAAGPERDGALALLRPHAVQVHSA